ncbi:hypothetical protein LTR84_006587 [Exophiala bonariae]|uniref:Autophagy-related protein n=1 Tax=Exophiala bonariae TaxID=1690606 RepID=A0AAV9N4A7_9EURO|nr:hypothetical protein LTR84_006587 [Exophiala bonariae]
MARSLMSWWKDDLARNTYVYTNFLIGIPFYLFGTYSVYQIQVTGFMIGTDGQGGPCMEYCIVPFGNGQLDLNSVLLYMNAMTFGIGGFVVIFIVAYADYWRRKTLLTTAMMVLYGIFVTPAYWLKNYTKTDFNSLIALWVMFGLLTFIFMALLNIYIPHCMRIVEENADPSEQRVEDTNQITSETKGQKYGFVMSIFGQVASSVSGVLMLIIVIILTVTLPTESGQNAGLIVTTVSGFVTIVGSVVCYYGLPELPTKTLPPGHSWKWVLLELILPFRDLLLRRKNMLFLLVGYTVYTDSLFALSSVTGQLFYVEIKPSTLEYSLYSIAGPIMLGVCTIVFYYLQRWARWNLEKCLIAGYFLILIVPIWGCIGLSSVDFGLKNRWEFYVALLVNFISQALANSTWRILYAELVPKGEEMTWFGLQIVLSCSTTWISYVANGPLQNATHQLRFPLVLCLIFLLVPVVLECFRATLPVFKKDKARWQAEDKFVGGTASPVAETPAKGFRDTVSQASY